MMPKRFQGGGLAVILATTMLGAAACGSGDAPSAGPATGDTQAETSLELSLGEGSAMASCIQFDTSVLADMSPAFAGTVTSVEGETVTLSIDHWYTGGDADTATLLAPAGMEALIGGLEFTSGEQYLITAANGAVNYCGYSGPATPDLTAAFDEAFGS